MRIKKVYVILLNEDGELYKENGYVKEFASRVIAENYKDNNHINGDVTTLLEGE